MLGLQHGFLERHNSIDKNRTISKVMASEENAKEVKMQQRLSPIYLYIFFIKKAKKNPCMTNLLGDQDS